MSYDYAALRAGLAPAGVPMPEYPVRLGTGAYATVYATDDGRAVKVTGDRLERFAALLVRDNPQRHLVRVDHVFSWEALTVLVVERLEQMGDAARHDWEKPDNITGCAVHGPARGRHGDMVVGTEMLHQWTPEWAVAAMEAIGRDLLSAGIMSCRDAHAYNVLVRPGTGELVLADLGLTRSSSEGMALALPAPGVEHGDPGDCHEDPAPSPLPPVVAPDHHRVRWGLSEAMLHPQREVEEGEVFRVTSIDRARGVVSLTRLPRLEKEKPAVGLPQRAEREQGELHHPF